MNYNFYTYIEEPKRSELANTCYSKASRHHLRHVGLLMAVEKSHGVPLLSQVYRANRHDSKIFSAILADLVVALKRLCGDDSDLVIVLDKGNNSSENCNALSGVISWLGAPVPSHYPDLIDLDLNDYHGFWKDIRYHRCQREVMGIDCALILIYNPATRRKQEHSLDGESINSKLSDRRNGPNTSEDIRLSLKAFGLCRRTALMGIYWTYPSQKVSFT